MTADVLDRRTLNRALLERQLLLGRRTHPVPDVVERLVGIQAQNPDDPYVGLWSRIDGVDQADLTAFGPATVADARAWSGLRGLREVFDQLREELRTFTDEDGRELFDLPDGPIPDRATPAPPRFLPKFDNAMLAHDDRSRIIPPAHYQRVIEVHYTRGTVLLDGFVAGFWSVRRDDDVATLTVEMLESPTSDDRDALREEGERLIPFVVGDVDEGRIEIESAAT